MASPRPRGLVEYNGMSERVAHIHHAGSVPLVQGLVKAGCTCEHASHGGHSGGIPLTQRLARRQNADDQ